jgi:DNA primase/DNA-binding transcriptional ArsR family regulator
LEAAVCRLLAEVAGHLSSDFPGSPAEEYLVNRGITTAIARAAGCGWCEKFGTIAAIAREYDSEVVVASGLYSSDTSQTKELSDETKRRWTQRLVVPQVLRGRTVNLWSRSVAPDAPDWLKNRYLNGRKQVGFWSDDARRSSRPVIAEGAIDAMSLRVAGFENACALGGLGDAERLRTQLGTHRSVVLVPDADWKPKGGKPGQEAALKLAGDLLRHGVDVRMVDLTGRDNEKAPTDPNDVLTLEGAGALHGRVEDALSPYEFRRRWGLTTETPLLLQDGSELVLQSRGLEFRCINLDAEKDEHGVKVALQVREAESDRALAMDSIPLYSSRRRNQVASEVAKSVAEDADEREEMEEAVRADLLELNDEISKWLVWEASRNGEQEEETTPLTEEERAEALELLQSPQLLERVVADAHRLGVVGEDNALKVGWLVLCSRLMDEPLFMTVKGESSAGKSYTLGTIIKFAPEDEVRDLSRMTPQALFYVEPGWAEHKLLFVRERAGGEEADYAIRTMLSERGLTLLVTERNEHDQLQSKERVVEGPIAYIETTTEAELHAENETRLLEMYLDESADQTARIHQRQREEATLSGLKIEVDHGLILRRHRNAQRLLHNVHVVIPYAKLLTFPASVVRQRRDHAKFLKLIRVIAFVHQHRKERHTFVSEGAGEVEYILADIEDYREAYELAPELFGPTMDELDRRTRRVLLDLWDYTGERYARAYGRQLDGEPTGDQRGTVTFTRREASRACGMPMRSVKRHLDLLQEMELLTVAEGGQGKAYHYKLTISDPRRPTLDDLTTPEELEERLAAIAAGEEVDVPRPDTSSSSAITAAREDASEAPAERPAGQASLDAPEGAEAPPESIDGMMPPDVWGEEEGDPFADD